MVGTEGVTAVFARGDQICSVADDGRIVSILEDDRIKRARGVFATDRNKCMVVIDGDLFAASPHGLRRVSRTELLATGNMRLARFAWDAKCGCVRAPLSTAVPHIVLKESGAYPSRNDRQAGEFTPVVDGFGRTFGEVALPEGVDWFDVTVCFGTTDGDTLLIGTATGMVVAYAREDTSVAVAADSRRMSSYRWVKPRMLHQMGSAVVDIDSVIPDTVLLVDRGGFVVAIDLAKSAATWTRHLDVVGAIRNRIVVLPGYLEFDEDRLGPNALHTSIIKHGIGDLVIDGIELAPVERFTATLREIRRGAEFELSVTRLDADDGRLRSGWVILSTNSPTQPTVHVYVHGI